MNTNNSTPQELYVELNGILNEIHKKGMKASWSSIGKIIGLSEQRARIKFIVFSVYIKSLKVHHLWDQANQAGSGKGFKPSLNQILENTSQEFTWTCSANHEFQSSIRKMKYSNAVCPHCKNNKNN